MKKREVEANLFIGYFQNHIFSKWWWHSRRRWRIEAIKLKANHGRKRETVNFNNYKIYMLNIFLFCHACVCLHAPRENLPAYSNMCHRKLNFQSFWLSTMQVHAKGLEIAIKWNGLCLKNVNIKHAWLPKNDMSYMQMFFW